jgi:hypothetical protein
VQLVILVASGEVASIELLQAQASDTLLREDR